MQYTRVSECFCMGDARVHVRTRVLVYACMQGFGVQAGCHSQIALLGLIYFTLGL